MKGQRLYIRELQAGDEEALERFYEDENRERKRPSHNALGLLGKILGNVVAHADAVSDGESMRIEHFYVTQAMRKMRIGRVLLVELESHAARRGCISLVALECPAMNKFFLNAGFVADRGTLRKVVTVTGGGE